MLKYDFNTKAWEILESNGEMPAPRWGASLTRMGDNLYLYGGRDNVLQFQEIYRYHIPTNVWYQLPKKRVPQPRYFHTGVRCHDSVIFLWGKNMFDFAFGDIIQYKFNTTGSVSESIEKEKKRNKDKIKM